MLQRHSQEELDIYVRELRWAEAFEHLAVSVAQLTLDGRLLTANVQLCEAIDRPESDVLKKQFTDFFKAEGSSHDYQSGLDELIAGKVSNYSTNMTAVRPDGRLIWVNTVFSLVSDGKTKLPRSLIALVKDISFLRQAMQERHDAEAARDELSRRMMNAQEADRTRIARELHDDIGQSLAVLKIRMLRAGQPISGHPEMVHAGLIELTTNLEQIIDNVSRLSHDLHSSELDLLGLNVTIKGHCRECSKQLRIPIDCSCDEVEEKLDSMTALAFLRVLQEALHNAAKHSRATSMTVRLTSSNRKLGLEIWDDGVGFDVESAKLAPGLGLISMRERIHLIGGEFEISSSAGKGTRISARAPIVQEAI